MKPLRMFEEYLAEGIVKKQAPNLSRAVFLIQESKDSYRFLLKVTKAVKISDEDSNFVVKSCYDIIMELIRAKMISEGYNSSGQGAHEAEVSYLRELRFPEVEIQFLNQLRFFRNGITYYGKKFNSEYAEKVLDFLSKIYPLLEKLTKI